MGHRFSVCAAGGAECAGGTQPHTAQAALTGGTLLRMGGDSANRDLKSTPYEAQQVLPGLFMADADALSAKDALAPVIQDGAGPGLNVIPVGTALQAA